MQRSVIQLAGKTLVVSLPAPWCRENGVKKGAKVELTSDNNTCLIELPSNTQKTRVLASQNITKLNAWYYLQAAYEAGVTQLEIPLGDNIDATTIRNIVKELPGFEIVRQGTRSITILEISTPIGETLPALIDRTIHLLVDYAKGCKDAATASPPTLDYIDQGDNPINRITSLCLRLGKRNHSLDNQYIRGLEAVGDLIRANSFAATRLDKRWVKQYLAYQEQAITAFHAAHFGKTESIDAIIRIRLNALRDIPKDNAFQNIALLCKNLAELLAQRIVNAESTSPAP